MKARTVVLSIAAAATLLQAFVNPGRTSWAAPGSTFGGGSPQTGTAVLTVTSGFAAQPGAVNPLAGKPLVLFRESFAAFLKRKGMFQGPPGAPAKLPPLGVWAYSCQTGSPACKQALYEMRPLSAGEAKTDAAGRATLPGVPPGTYYLFSLAPHDGRLLVWDLRVDLKPGSNAVSLDQHNSAPLDAEQARAQAPAAEAAQSAASTNQCPVTDRPKTSKPGVRPNSTLSVIGVGYVYTVTNLKTGDVVSQTEGNFSNATLYLLDDDAENVLQSAGMGPGLMGDRFATLAFTQGVAQGDKVPIVGDLLSTPIGQEAAAMVSEAKADLECVMRAVRAHSAAEMTTDANARGTFPSVPAGTYYLYGWYYRVRKPVRAGPVAWNLKVELKPGQNTLRLSVKDAVYAP